MTKEKQSKTKANKESGISDVIKKVVSVGIGAAFMTEDAVKNVLQDLPLPKDIVSDLLSNAKNAKEDFRNSIMQEVRGQFSKIEPSKLIDEILEKYDIEITSTLKFSKKDDKKKGDDS